MPTVTKQVGGAVPANGAGSDQPSTGGSILSRAVAVNRLADDWVKMVIYGQNRVGKTTLACQAPKPLLLVSFEPGQQGGAKSVKKMAGVTLLPINRKSDAVQLARDLRDEGRSNWRQVKTAKGTVWQDIVDARGNPSFVGEPWRTHVLDGATSLQDVILAELMGLDHAPVQLNWGSVSQDFYRERSEQAKEVMRLFRDLPCNTIFCAKEKDHNPPKDERNKVVRGLQTESFFSADVGGATAQWMNDACDYICQLQIVKEIKEVRQEMEIAGVSEVHVQQVETGRLVRRLRTTFHPNFAAGFRSENPQAVPEFIMDPTWAKIAQVIRGEPLDQR